MPIPAFLFRTVPSKLGFNKKSNDVKKHIGEHKKKTGITNLIMNRIWASELNKIKEGKRVSIGGSCFVIAKKK